jgi:hypothetical protein
MSTQLDEQDFRNHSRELALSQLALLFTDFDGLGRFNLRFAIGETDELRRHLAGTIEKFIEETPVQLQTQELMDAGKGQEHSIEARKYMTDYQRRLLKDAGLVAPPPATGE